MEREKYGFTIMVTGSFPVIVYDSIQEGQIKPRSQRIWSTPFGFPSHPSIFLTVIVFQRNLVCYSKGLQFLIFYPFEIDPSWLHPVQQLGNGLIFCYRVYWHSSIIICHIPLLRSIEPFLFLGWIYSFFRGYKVPSRPQGISWRGWGLNSSWN